MKPLVRWSLGLWAACGLLHADDRAAILDTFVAPSVAALGAGDPASIKRFVHPTSLGCLDADAQRREYLDFVLGMELNGDAKGPYDLTEVKPLSGPPPLFGLPAEHFIFPVTPVYQIQVSFRNTSQISIHFVAPLAGVWYEVLPCPDAQGMEFFHQNLTAGAEQKKKVARLASELKDPLRGELQALVDQGQLISAIKKYQQAAGVDLTTAKMVVVTLQKHPEKR